MGDQEEVAEDADVEERQLLVALYSFFFICCIFLSYFLSVYF